MASISVISEPSEFNEVGNCIKWVFRMTGVRTETTESRFIYWLEDSNGNKITFKDFVVPAEGKNFPIDLSEELKRKVSTEPPSFNSSFTTMIDQPEMILEFTFNYEIVTFDKVSCEKTTSAETELGSYNAINVASNWYKPMVLTDTTGQIINRKAPIIHVANNSQDWLYVWNDTFVIITYFDSNGNQLLGSGVLPDSVVGKISAWGVGPGNIGDDMPTGCAFYIVNVKSGDTSSNISKTTYIIDCDQDNMDLYFFDGGYSGLSMTIVSRGVKGTQSIVNQHNSSCNPFTSDNLTRKGPTSNNKVDYSVITLEKELDDEREESHEYFRRAKVSGNYYISHPISFVANKMIKFMVTSSSIVYDIPGRFPVLRITGQINVPYKTANHFI